MTITDDNIIADRIARSKQAFKTHLPQVACLLPTGLEVTKMVTEGNAVVNIDLGEGYLYSDDARKLAAEHCEHFGRKPLRFFLNEPGASNIGSPMSDRMLRAMQKAIKAEDEITLTDKPDYVGTFMIVLGLGLGHHLPLLIATTKARHVLIVEPFKEFTLHSFAAIDWEALFETADERDIEINFVFSDQPEQIIQRIQDFVMKNGDPLIDGAYVFLHYNAWPLVETRDRLQLMINDIFIARGFFEDELLMMKNATKNLIHHESRLIDARPKRERPETVLIVGSGPSLDQSADDLKRLAKDAIVMSCGTGLKACLGHGVVPDFHVEIENVESTYTQIALTAEKYDLKGIVLAASVTVDPRIPPLFGGSFFFFRDSLSSTRTLMPDYFELMAAAPTCVNGALRFSTALGVTKMILFGTDCGAKVGGPRHSKNSLYADNEIFKKWEENTEFNITMPANFGGEVKASWALKLCQRYLGEVIHYYGLKVFNTSDGARIRDAVPRRASTIRHITPACDRDEFMRMLTAQTHENHPGQWFENFSASELVENVREMFEATLGMADDAITEQDDMVAFLHRSRAFMKEEKWKHSRALSIIDGTIRSSPKIAMFFAHRVEDRDIRRRVIDAFLIEFRAIVEEMKRQTLDLLDTVFAEIKHMEAAIKAEADRFVELSL